jgi:hypothetical protein
MYVRRETSTHEALARVTRSARVQRQTKVGSPVRQAVGATDPKTEHAHNWGKNGGPVGRPSATRGRCWRRGAIQRENSQGKVGAGIANTAAVQGNARDEDAPRSRRCGRIAAPGRGRRSGAGGRRCHRACPCWHSWRSACLCGRWWPAAPGRGRCPPRTTHTKSIQCRSRTNEQQSCNYSRHRVTRPAALGAHRRGTLSTRTYKKATQGITKQRGSQRTMKT